jgi:hypothetical protein
MKKILPQRHKDTKKKNLFAKNPLCLRVLVAQKKGEENEYYAT